MTQFYKLTLEEAIALYQRGIISTSGLLYFFLRIRLAPGWKMTLHQRAISKKLGISKSRFYRAIHKLKDEGLIDWEAPNGLVVTFGVSSSNQNSVSVSETEFRQSEFSSADRNSVAVSETPVTPSETPVTPSETPVTPSETGIPPQPPADTGSPPSSDSYQIFIKSLSDSGREEFLDFVREQTKNLTQPINDLEGWLANKNSAGQNRWEVYHNNFLTEQKTKAQIAKQKTAVKSRPSLAEEIEQRRMERLKAKETTQEEIES